MVFILSVGSDEGILSRRSAVLAQAGYAVVSVTNPSKAAEKIVNEEFDAVVLCNFLGEEDRRQLVNVINRHRPFMPVVQVPESQGEDGDFLDRDSQDYILQAVAELFPKETGSQVV